MIGKRRGRPTGKRYVKRVHVAASLGEELAWKMAAEAAGLRLSQWIRASLRAAAGLSPEAPRLTARRALKVLRRLALTPGNANSRLRDPSP